MAQCCDDERALLLDDFEDGSFPARYSSIVGSPAVTAGSGINGSHGLVGGAYADELFYTNPSHTDICGEGRRAFAVSAYFTPASETDEFHIFEILDTDPFSGPVIDSILSIEQSLRDLVVHVGGSSGVVIFRIHNAFSAGTRIKVEGIGSISHYNDTLGDSESDGWIEIRLNGRVYQNGDEYPAIDPTSDPPDCPKGTSGIQFALSIYGWQCVSFSPVSIGGVLDCLYLAETATYCHEIIPPTGGTPRCPDPRPGGDPNGPRTVQPGGYPAAYVPEAGGGRLPTASDPTDAQTMTAIATPIVTLDVTLPDASVKRWSTRAVPRTSGPPHEARITRWGEVLYPFSNRFGNMAAQTWEVDVADSDNTIRALIATGANRFYKRWEGHLYIEDNAARLAGTARRSVARGRVISVRLESDLVVTFVFADELSRHDSPFSLDRELPHVLINQVYGVTATGAGLVSQMDPPQDAALRPTPILLGEYSDERRITENPPVIPVGIAPLIYVGDFQLTDGAIWNGYLVALYPVRIAALFGSNLDRLCPVPVRLDPDLFSSEFLVPDQGNWSSYFSTNYNDITKEETTYRMTMIFGRGPRSQAHLEGKVLLTCNVNGVEDVGDNSGDMIDDLAFMTEFLFEHPIFRQTTTGTWGSYAAFADGTSKVRHSSFTTAKAIQDGRIGTGYKGALGMYERRAARDWLADLLVSADLRMGLNHHGQVLVATLDDAATLTGLTTFVDQLHIKDQTFKLTSELNAELENVLSWEAGPEESTGRTSVQKTTMTIATSVTNWGDTYKAQELQFKAIYQQPIGADVAGRRLLATMNGITSGAFDTDFRGGDLTQGQLIRSDDLRGLGATGWTQRLLRVTDRILLLNESDLLTRVVWEDVHEELVAPATLAPGGGVTTSRVGFRPVGNTDGSPSDGWVVGNVADSTAWRVG